ncbi:MAG: DNA/RNA nuclease SfsA [Gammaproteobacteria bacterium]|nr:DNA/RNA nuclease SfsA [Gammaproteobacteria bacterium]
MQLPSLYPGTIRRRYKRFLADVTLADGREVVAHCPNTGAMTSCWAPGVPVQVSHSDNPRRKLAWTLERIDMGGGWIGVHTGRVNGVVAEGIELGRVPELAGYPQLRPEHRYHAPGLPASRLDLYLSGSPRLRDALVEVKNTTLLSADGERLLFPDAVSERGRKHLEVLMYAVRQGLRGVMIFALNRPEGTRFAPADEVDPAYGETLRRAAAAGIELLALRLAHTDTGIRVAHRVPLWLDADD